jgi:translation initiation factor 2 subunit 2
METYEQLLNDAYIKVKPIEGNGERFEIPQADVFVEGIRTIITNFQQICSFLRRDPNHIEKFLQKELASGTKQSSGRLIFQRKLLTRDINEKLRLYVEKFVICRECGKPDTEIVKQDSYFFIHCLACGAKHSIVKI